MDTLRLRIASVDYGTRHVGLAMTDPLRIFAQPIGTFPPDEAVERLRALHESDGLEAIVLGWPLTEDGKEGKATRRVEPFFGRLRNVFKGVEVVKYDERYSTRRAATALVEAGVKRGARRTAKKKGHLDATAATIILQDYLEEFGA